MKNFQKYIEAVKYLESITNITQPDYMTTTRGRSLFLKRFNYFLNRLGNPHKKLKYIHVGGSSGKGSVALMIQSILTQADFTTGVYTSPYFTTPAEKIKVDNKLISAKEFSDLVEKLKPVIDKAYVSSPYGRPSWYEISTALALLYFIQKKCDYAVLEVGLGGRYDATNVIPAPQATVINFIDFDHTQLLGNTLAKIAKEKAAIIKPKTRFFTPSTNSKKVKEIFKRTCQRKKAQFNLIEPPAKPYPLKLLGKHQQLNAAIAEAVAKKLDIRNSVINQGLKKVKLPCRLEIIQKIPLVILDGAHNRSKINSTTQAIKNLTYQKLYLIIALTNERNANNVFKTIIPLADYIYITRFLSSHRQCYPPLELAKKLKTKKPKKIFLDPHQALKSALNQASNDDLVLVTGSLFLAGELRKRWRREEMILKEQKA